MSGQVQKCLLTCFATTEQVQTLNNRANQLGIEAGALCLKLALESIYTVHGDKPVVREGIVVLQGPRWTIRCNDCNALYEHGPEDVLLDNEAEQIAAGRDPLWGYVPCPLCARHNNARVFVPSMAKRRQEEPKEPKAPSDDEAEG